MLFYILLDFENDLSPRKKSKRRFFFIADFITKTLSTNVPYYMKFSRHVYFAISWKFCILNHFYLRIFD